MNKKIYFQIFWETLPLLLGIILTGLLWKHNFLLTIIYLIVIAVILKIKHYHGDIHALIYGYVIGFIIETIGTSIAGYQSFTNPDFWGIPFWLPIAWAYGFMLMKRIGIIIYEAQKKN